LKKRKKILLITSEFPPQPGGIGQHAYDLAYHLAQTEYVVVLADQRSSDGNEEADFDAQQNFQVKRTTRYALLLFTYIKRLILAINLANKIDVVLVSGKFSLWQGGLIRLLKYKPIIAIIHGTEVLLANTYFKKLTDRCLQSFDHVIAVSNYTLGLVDHLGIKNTSVIPNGIRLDHQLSQKAQASQEVQLITVGNLTQRKGQHNVIRALPRLVEKYPTLKYHCVGIPTDKEQLIQLADQLKVRNHIVFHGRVNNQDKERLLQQADIFMMLSERTECGDVEGFGIAILEANQFGTPAVGSISSGVEDAIQDGYSGFLVDPHHSQAVVKAVESILENYEFYSQHSASRVKAFDWKHIIYDYRIIIESIVKNERLN